MYSVPFLWEQEKLYLLICVCIKHIWSCVCGGREQEEASWGHLAISGDISCCHRMGCCGQSGKQPRTLLDIPQEQNSTIVMWPPVPRLRTPDLAGLTEPYNVGFNAGYHSRRASLVAQWSGIHLQCRRPGSIPRSGRSPGEVNGSPHQYSCLENSMDREACQTTVYRAQRVGHDWATNTHTPVLHSFLLLRSVPLYMYARLCFSIHQLMDVFGLFLAFCQLWIKLLGTFVCNLWTSVITSLGSMSRSGHMVSVCLTL